MPWTIPLVFFGRHDRKGGRCLILLLKTVIVICSRKSETGRNQVRVNRDAHFVAGTEHKEGIEYVVSERVKEK